MRLSEAISSVRSAVNEKVPRFYDPEEIIRWINEAVRDIARRVEFFQVKDDISVLAGTQEYTCPEDVLRITRAEYVPTGTGQPTYTLDYVDVQGVDQFFGMTPSTQGYPCIFTLFGFPPNLKITLYPNPTAAGILTLFYYKVPAYVEDPDALLEIPDGWFDLVNKYAIYMAYMKDRDQQWQVFKQLYEQDLDVMQQRTQRWSDQAGMITTGRGMGVPRHLWDWDY